jgi:hypothetical protein
MGNRINTTITGRTPTSVSPASAMYLTNTVNQYVFTTGLTAASASSYHYNAVGNTLVVTGSYAATNK